jgi:hypothetical protein
MQNHNIIYVRQHYAQTNTNNVNKTWTLLQTTGIQTNRTSFLCGNRNKYHNTELLINVICVCLRIVLSNIYYIVVLHCRYRIKGILFSILSLSWPLSGEPSGEPDRVRQMIVLIKTSSNTNSPLFCLSVIYIQKSLKRWKTYVLQLQKRYRI